MSAERVAEARQQVIDAAFKIHRTGIYTLLEAFETAVRSDQRARDFPPVTIDAEEGAA